MLKIANMHTSIGGIKILQNINLSFPAGKTAGLIGRNGAGKTTLMRSLMGLLPIDSGSIEFFDRDLNRVSGFKRAHIGFGYMPEDRRLVPELTVEENILLPCWTTKGETNRIRWIYKTIPELSYVSHQRALNLSGGQQKLVALARALMAGTKLLLLDEPFEGVAPALARRLAEVIDSLKNEGLSVLLSESNLSHSEDLIDHLFIIERGNVRVQDNALN